MEIVAIAALAGLCKTVIETGRALRDGTLSNDEERILQQAGHHGVVELIIYRGFLTVYAEGKVFEKDIDRLECARYVTAFRSLCERGLLHPEGDNRFTLASSAFELGRKLAEERHTLDRKQFRRPYIPYLTADEREVLVEMQISIAGDRLLTAPECDAGTALYIGNHEWQQGHPDQEIRSRLALQGLLAKGLIESIDEENYRFLFTQRGASTAEAILLEKNS